MDMQNVYDILQERGYIEQATAEEEIRDLLGREPVTFYIGFDPTADSLHVGHFIQVMVMMHMQRAGHRPIALLGGGTAMVGDPSGKSDMRKMLTEEIIADNARLFQKQFSKFLDFGEGKAIMVNNADWLLGLNYIEFLRTIGVHFNVNRMLSAECFKNRMEKGLTFLEFNYMIMQAYDFLELFRRYNCKMQLGGNDQWSNIIAGADLVRKVDAKPAYGLTFTLLTTSEGKKMGKTESGALWLDAEKTPPYDFYQYWRNVDDRDVEKCLALLTFIPMEEVRRLGALEGSAINEAKETLAFEVTKMVHGEDEAVKAENAARALFAGAEESEDIPFTHMEQSRLDTGIDIISVLVETGLASSRSDGRRLISQGGIYVNNERIEDETHAIHTKDLDNGKILIRKGKKIYHQIRI
jgi:tyrosyl-tRNA synthetase